MDHVWIITEEYTTEYAEGTHICGVFESENGAKKALRKIWKIRKGNFKDGFEKIKRLKNAYTFTKDGFREMHIFMIEKFSLNNIVFS